MLYEGSKGPRSRQKSAISGLSSRIMPFFPTSRSLKTSHSVSGEEKSLILNFVQGLRNTSPFSRYAIKYPGDQLSEANARERPWHGLVIEPSLLLPDEPVSALDAVAQENMRSQLRTYVRKSDILCIAVTHLFRDAVSLGDRLGVMERGRIVQNGALEEIKGSGNTFLRTISSVGVRRIRAGGKDDAMLGQDPSVPPKNGY